MKNFLYLLLLIGFSLVIFGCQPASEPTRAEDLLVAANAETFAANRRIMRSVKLGDALDGPREGAWGLFLKED